MSLSSCNHNSGIGEKGLKEIDLSRIYNHMSEEVLSSIADSINYISLQTDSNIILGPILKPWKSVQFSDSLLFISDGQQLLTFNHSGKFISRIGNKGNGPNEYQCIDSFSLLKNKRQVLILNSRRRELLIFDYQGSYIKSIKVKFWPTQISSLNASKIALSNDKGSRKSSDYHTISIMDDVGILKNRLISQFQEREIERSNSIAGWNLSYLYNYCDTLSYWESYYNTIWRIPDDSHATPAFKINLGDDKMPFDYFLETNANKNWNNFVNILRIFETKKYIFFRIAFKSQLRNILYNKTNGLLKCTKFTSNGNTVLSFRNDIDGGMPFWPEGVKSENQVFSIIYGYELLSKLESNDRKANSKYETIFSRLMHSNIKISDNPIIMVVKIRN